ncbi:LbtU family siderophore porin [Magnetococcus sp. PR-3]|uniref:LbtU family siderophore porin n=1 Tax=Magnetococcus sp. PR-3 TaxID=3120355 RepID=UPI002FCE29C8
MSHFGSKSLMGAAALMAAFCVSSQASAQDLPSRAEMWKMIQMQQQQIQSLQQKLGHTSQKVAKVEKVAEEAKTKGGGGSNWSDKITIGGTVEASASTTENKSGTIGTLADGSDVNLDKAELTVDAKVNPWVSANVTMLYDGDSATAVDVDAATITVGNAEKLPVSLTVGKMTLPFGTFETNMVSDPITLEMAETADSAAQVNFAKNGFTMGAYLFNATSQKTGDDNQLDQFGFNLGYATEVSGVSAEVGLHFINSVENSGGISTAMTAANLALDDRLQFSLGCER